MAKRTKAEVGFRGRSLQTTNPKPQTPSLRAEALEVQAAELREDVESTGSPLLDERFRRIRIALATQSADLAEIGRGLDRLKKEQEERSRGARRGENVAFELRSLGARSVCLTRDRGTRRGSDTCLQWESRRVVRGIIPEVEGRLLCDGCRFAWYVEMAARIAEEEPIARRSPP
jgi:hypothetical protein